MAKRAEKNQLGLVRQILSQSVFLGGEQYVFLEKEAVLKGLTITQMANRIIDQYRDNKEK